MSVRPFGYRVLVSDLPNPDEHRQIVLPPTVREHDLRRGVVEAAPPEESEPTGSAAATSEPAPIVQRESSEEDIPTREPASTCAAWTIAMCPTVTSFSSTQGVSSSTWKTQLS